MQRKIKPAVAENAADDSASQGWIEKAIGLVAQLIASFDTVLEKVNRLTETNYELACRMAQQGKVKDAILRFRITLWIAPNHEPSLYNLACLYHYCGQSQKALQLLSTIIRANPKHALAQYMISIINPAILKPELRPTMVPTIILQEYFDALAPRYDVFQREQQYRLPVLVQDLLKPLLATDFEKNNLLDLGCGTGMAVMPYRHEFVNIVGVDLSVAMLDIAYSRFDSRGIKIYSRLANQDVRVYLAQPEMPAFDLVMALSLLPYLGDLESTFAGVAKALRPGGIFVCDFDPYNRPGAFGVMPETGYFGHRIDDVLALAARVGLVSLRTGEVQSTLNKKVDLCFFQKPVA